MEKISIDKFGGVENFIKALNGADVNIGKTGGRYFKIKDKNNNEMTVRLNDLVEFTRENLSSNIKDVKSRVLIRLALEDLDNKGNEELKKSSPLKNALTTIKQIVGNSFYKRDLSQISNLEDKIEALCRSHDGGFLVEGLDQGVNEIYGKEKEKKYLEEILRKKELTLNYRENFFANNQAENLQSYHEFTELVKGQVTSINIDTDEYKMIPQLKLYFSDIVNKYENLKSIKITFTKPVLSGDRGQHKDEKQVDITLNKDFFINFYKEKVSNEMSFKDLLKKFFTEIPDPGTVFSLYLTE